MEILSVLRSDGMKHLCLTRYFEEEGYRDLFQQFDLDLILSKPTLLSEEKYISSVIGNQRDLMRYIELIKENIGKVLKMSFTKPHYTRRDVLSILTERQKEVLTTAQRSGYYEYPKKITSERLAEKVKMSRGTMLEHLRKAEGRIFEELVAGRQ
jgi:predicted DNA binding protein